LLSTIRNPYDWYVSQYEFGWWKRTSDYYPESHPTPVGAAIERALPAFKKEHPEFPEINFDAFIELCDQASLIYQGAEAKRLGLLTHGFIQYFYRDLHMALSRMSDDYISSGRYGADMFDVRFLRTNQLNRDLYEALTTLGYSSHDVQFILTLGKIFPTGRGRGEHQLWERYFTPAQKSHVRGQEWVLFKMFPEFDV